MSTKAFLTLPTKRIIVRTLHSAFCASLSALFMLCAFGQTAAAETGEPGEPSVDIKEFLSEMELTFDQYLAVMTEFEADGIYPHYLEKNVTQYTQYRYNNPDIPRSTAMAYVNVNVDTEFYSNIREVTNPDSVSLLVNKHHKLSSDWAPKDLVNIGNGYRLRSEAAEAYFLMKEEMNGIGLNLNVVSAYRTYYSQESSHRSSSRYNGIDAADQDLARAGHSEHQTGLTMDVLHRSHSGRLANAHFQDTAEYAWMLENAHNFGFILRYPSGYEHIHGYVFEPWHWRYVGADIATAMYNEGIVVYEEFYGKYLASDVLEVARELILAQRASMEDEERERRRLEAAERLAAEDAALAERQAAYAAQEAAYAAAEAARRDAALRQTFVLVVALFLIAIFCYIVVKIYTGIRRRMRYM